MIFVFFGHPGAGKSTLTQRFGTMHNVTAIDSDLFMTAEERTAVTAGRYTQAMRLANITRYTDHVQRAPGIGPHVGLADGLPNNVARRFLIERFPAGTVVLVLVQTDRRLWEQRLAARTESPVNVTVAEALAYIRDNWEPVAANLPYELIENDDPVRTDELLRTLFERYANGQFLTVPPEG